MTNVLLENIKEVSDLALFSDAYKKGCIKLNVTKLANELNKDRKTIRKYLNGDISTGTRKRIKYLDLYRDSIIDLLSDKHRSFDYIDHLYYYLVREHTITCSRSTLNRYIREDEELDKLFRRKKNQKFYERFETNPGIQAQFDLKERIKIIYETGEVQRINVATLTLGFSRYNIREVVLDTKYETVTSFLANAFETLGGVPKELVIDNIKCLVDKPRTKGRDAVLNVRFEEFLKEYDISCKPCMPYRPETKGKTETQNKKPSQLENYNGVYKDLLDVHDKLKIINEEDNMSVSQATNLPRIVLLKKEKDCFHPLPSQSVRKQYYLSLNPVAVSNESLVSYRSNKYSVPKSMIGRKVNLVVKDVQLHIYYHNKIIAVHQITNNKLNILSQHQLNYENHSTHNDTTEVVMQEMRNIKYD